MEKGKDIPFNRQEGYRLESTKVKGDKGMPDNNSYGSQKNSISRGGSPSKPAGYEFGPSGKYKC